MTTPETSELLCTKKAARLLGLSPRTLRNWRVRGGGPPYIRISARCIRYRQPDLTVWAEARITEHTSTPALS